MAHGGGPFVWHAAMLHHHIVDRLLVRNPLHLSRSQLQKVNPASVDFGILRILPQKRLRDREGIPSVLRAVAFLCEDGAVLCLPRVHVQNPKCRQLIDAVPEHDMLIIHKRGGRTVMVAAGHGKHLPLLLQSPLVADPQFCDALRETGLAGIDQELAVRTLRLSSVHPPKSGSLIFTYFPQICLHPIPLPSAYSFTYLF